MDARAYPLEFLYDGQCPMCRHDVARLGRRDRQGRLRFVDVNGPGFDPNAYGTDREALLARLHGRRADGVMVSGAEVFRLALGATGLEHWATLSRLPVLRWLTDQGYELFARHRIALARRFGGWFVRFTPICDDNVCQRRQGGDAK